MERFNWGLALFIVFFALLTSAPNRLRKPRFFKYTILLVVIVMLLQLFLPWITLNNITYSGWDLALKFNYIPLFISILIFIVAGILLLINSSIAQLIGISLLVLNNALYAYSVVNIGEQYFPNIPAKHQYLPPFIGFMASIFSYAILFMYGMSLNLPDSIFHGEKVKFMWIIREKIQYKHLFIMIPALLLGIILFIIGVIMSYQELTNTELNKNNVVTGVLLVIVALFLVIPSVLSLISKKIK